MGDWAHPRNGEGAIEDREESRPRDPWFAETGVFSAADVSTSRRLDSRFGRHTIITPSARPNLAVIP